MRSFVAVLVGVCSFCAFGATQRYVSRDKSYGSDVEGAVLYDKLQEAIDACKAGDTVWVKNGFECKPETDGYSTDHSATVVFKEVGRITIRGESGEWQTGPVIYGDKSKGIRCFYTQKKNSAGTSNSGLNLFGFRLEEGGTPASGNGGGICDSERQSCVVSNCYVANCSAMYGGGVHGQYLTLYNCVISNCTASGYGSGCVSVSARDTVFIDNDGEGYYLTGNVNATMTRCKFIRNTGGGAVSYPNDSYKTTFNSCEFIENSGATYGGGVSGKAQLNDCVFFGNSGASGGAVACYLKTSKSWFYPQSVVCTRCVFSNNTATTSGSVGWYGKFVNCRIEGNAANSTGQGTLYGSQAYNCLIANNTAAKKGAAIYAITGYYGADCGCELVNCTVVSNTVTSGGAVVQIADGATLSCVNTIVCGNSAPAADAITTATNCCLEATAQVGSGEGNVTCDPKLVKATGALPYHLKQASTLIGKGKVIDWMSDETDARSKDLDGQPRLTGGTVSLGCYEKPYFRGLTLLVR